MRTLPRFQDNPLPYLIGLSLLVHISGMFTVHAVLDQNYVAAPQPVKIRVVNIPKPEEEKPAELVPPKPKDIPPKVEKKPEQRLEKKPPAANAQKVQGLTADSVSDKGTVAAPVGNSLMVEDKGIRLSPEEIASLKRDLSSSALLIHGSFKTPEYTQAALDANLEGQFVVDVYVDAQGKVLDADLRKKIGYGMDERVLDVAKSSRFTPAKNEKGVPRAEWTEIKFNLEIP